MVPCSCVGVKFPLVDTSEHNGSFQVCPATQHVLDQVLPKGNGLMNPALNREGSGIFSTRLNLQAGDLWIQDGRCFHRVSAPPCPLLLLRLLSRSSADPLCCATAGHPEPLDDAA